MNYKLVCFNLLLFSGMLLHAQVDDDLMKFFTSNRKGQYIYNETGVWLKQHRLPKDKLLNYYSDKKKEDISFLFGLVYQEALLFENDEQKKNNVDFLVSQGISDDYPFMESVILSYLNNFPLRLFTPQSRSILAAKVLHNQNYHEEYIRLAGKLKLTELIPYLQSLLVLEKNTISIKWSAHLALGKMGDVDQVKACVQRVKQIGMNDRVVFNLIPDLLYLNSRLAYDYILDQILLDEENCTSTNPDHEVPINCAYRLIEMIAPHINDFPVELYESGDIATESYALALKQVRNWILNNHYLYEIISE